MSYVDTQDIENVLRQIISFPEIPRLVISFRAENPMLILKSLEIFIESLCRVAAGNHQVRSSNQNNPRNYLEESQSLS